ncbi:MAG: type II toxin-antitoxin system VapC family toxin [Candidatus Latescibacteria bacterium]|jgi:PIN domain nuclease of toxin-antitoxin system|nr:type II toxin-antitoxin system VapC family toxin [Candidatus Latescibacterota bacterium]MBT4141349.1 type II toxin-antitoxin system VapC family toxin [Candidatus Latescibacterota bacterium]MBT5829606.1 type II toxin-antitoxin system VapC family toxin [Candidatus Latescibacterota bacterium]
MILLDTHAWLWWTTESPQLSEKAKQTIENTPEVGVSILSCWEVAMLVSKGRIALSLDVQAWIDLALQRPKVRLLQITPEIVVLSTRLPGDFHADPTDRMLAATCLSNGIPIVTKDQKITEWNHISTIW